MQMCVTGAQTGEGNASSDGDFMKARNHPIQERGTEAQHFHVTTSEIKSTLNEIRHGIDELPSRRLSSARIPVESFVTDTSLRVGSEFASTSRLDRERSCSVADGSVLLKGGSEPFLEEGSIWVGRTLGSTMPENQSRQHSASNSLQPESAIDSIGFSKAIRSIECLENGVEVGDRESNLLVLHETPVHSPGRAANLTASRDSPIKDETIMQVNCSVDRVCEIERVAINKEKSSDRVENFRGPLGSKKAAGSTEENCSHEDVWECHPSLVLLHVYDLTPNISKYVNTVMRPLGAGAFHAGVEVFGDEYCFGRTNDGSTGITVNEPRHHPAHIYRETICMGVTDLSQERFSTLLDALKLEWLGSSYDILTRNCINFADELCYLLGVGSIPRWLFALQEHATSLQQHVQSATGGIAAAAQRIQNFDHKAGLTATAAAAAATAAAAAKSIGGFIKHTNEGLNFVAERLYEGVSCLPVEWNEEETEHFFSNTPSNAVFERCQPSDELPPHFSLGSADPISTQQCTRSANGEGLEKGNKSASSTKRMKGNSGPMVEHENP